MSLSEFDDEYQAYCFCTGACREPPFLCPAAKMTPEEREATRARTCALFAERMDDRLLRESLAVHDITEPMRAALQAEADRRGLSA